MLLIPLYHRTLGKARSVTPIEILKPHLEYIADHFTTCFPGESLKKGKSNICLTFDDAYADFYYIVYPLLKQLKLKAVIAPITKYTADKTDLPKDRRLSMLKEFESLEKQPGNTELFCSYEELQEMIASGFVQIACHTHSHVKVDLGIDFNLELLGSKQQLEEKLDCSVNTLIYPFGSYSKQMQKEVEKLFLYSMRIGNGCNYSWNNSPLLRICLDQMKNPMTPFLQHKLMAYRLKHCVSKVKKTPIFLSDR